MAAADESCPFCKIAATYAPFPPTSPPPSSSSILSPSKTLPETSLILSTPTVVAFLDIMPLTPYHLLLCPRAHAPKLTDVPPDEAAEVGRYLPVLSRALVQVLGEGTDWNVVQNNGVGAGQVVGHVHFHVIPRVSSTAAGAGPGDGGKEKGGKGNGGGMGERFRKSYAMFGKGQRSELDEEEGREMAERLREAVAEVMREAKL